MSLKQKPPGSRPGDAEYVGSHLIYRQTGFFQKGNRFVSWSWKEGYSIHSFYRSSTGWGCWMSKLKPVSTRKLIRILVKLGFVKIRQKGSHSFFQHP